jgi:hypothetical protein
VAKRAKCCGCEFKTATPDRADAFTVNSQSQTFKKPKRFGLQRHSKGGSQMQPANEVVCNLFVPLLIVLILGGVVVCQFLLSGKEF